jgi:hypothetical protein
MLDAELADALDDVAVDADPLGDVDPVGDVAVLPDAPLLADGDAVLPPPQAAKIGRSSASSNPEVRFVRDIFIDS